MAMMAELSHLEEIIGQLDKHTADPFSLPSSTEQVRLPQANSRYDDVVSIIITIVDPSNSPVVFHFGCVVHFFPLVSVA